MVGPVWIAYSDSSSLNSSSMQTGATVDISLEDGLLLIFHIAVHVITSTLATLLNDHK